jgi:hypothetical protein
MKRSEESGERLMNKKLKLKEGIKLGKSKKIRSSGEKIIACFPSREEQ